MKVCGIVNGNGEWLEPPPAISSFSPLLSIQLTEEVQAFLASIHKGIPSNQANSTKP
jgi:hypothetical protein